MTFESLSQIGPYYLIRRIVEQTYYATYESTHPSSGERVVVTVFARKFADQPDFAARFEPDVARCQRASSTHLVRCLGGGIDDATSLPYVVTEFVKGPTLAELLQGSALPPLPQLCDYVAQAAEGLRALMKAGSIHRDVRPASLQLSDAGVLKVINLGRGELLPRDAFRLGPELMVGSPLYLAPEVAMGQRCDHRADLYSLAATAFHMLAGQPLFAGSQPDSILKQHTSTPPRSLAQANPAIPLPFAELLNDLLLKDPGQRYADYDTFLIDWRATLKNTDFDEGMDAAEAPSRAPGVAAGAAVGGSIGGGIADLGAGAASSDDLASPLGGGITDLQAIMPGHRAGIAGPRAEGPGQAGAIGLPARGKGDRYDHDAGGPNVLKLLIYLILLGAVGGGGYAFYTMGVEGVFRWVSGEGGGAQEDEKVMARAAFDATELRMEKLGAKMQILVAGSGKTPSVEELLASGVDRAELTDGYGNLLRVDGYAKTVISAGPDGTRGSADDFVYDWGRQRMTQKPRRPEPDVTLEEQEFETRLGGGR